MSIWERSEWYCKSAGSVSIPIQSMFEWLVDSQYRAVIEYLSMIADVSDPEIAHQMAIELRDNCRREWGNVLAERQRINEVARETEDEDNSTQEAGGES